MWDEQVETSHMTIYIIICQNQPTSFLKQLQSILSRPYLQKSDNFPPSTPQGHPILRQGVTSDPYLGQSISLTIDIQCIVTYLTTGKDTIKRVKMQKN